VGKYGTAGQATDDGIIRLFASWLSKNTEKHSECVKLIAFILQRRLLESTSILR
jgi:hypothetical protein